MFRGSLSIRLWLDPVGNLTALTLAGNPTPELRLDYDALGRLTALKDGTTETVIDGYSYDGTGNRLSAKVGGATQAYTYPTTNHRLGAVAGVARTYDKMGNTLTIGGKAREYLYDTTGRMTQVKRAGAAVMNYRYNGRGEQVRRYLGTTNTYTLYDEAGHWLGDYDTNGAPKQQAIWLDDLPVGLLANGAQLHYIEPDHLGSPRVVVDAARDVAVWNWSLKGEAFGNTAPNQDPDGDGTAMIFDMRFPGQRFDVASGFNQNYFRDYDAATGRYGQSDLIGLVGGISTYAYVEGNPVGYVDPYGLEKLVLFTPGANVFYQGASVDTETPGVWSVYGHMGPDRILDQSSGQTNKLDVDGIAQVLRGAGWTQGEPVEFKGCRSGQGENSIAEQFARKYKTPTSGATQYMWYSNNGITGIWGKVPYYHTKNYLSPGVMRNFPAGGR
ncbi:RHS repeat-associated protein [Xanthomonas campestris]|nr:RHS repeat-associated protein [Xanthomonas sp. 3075]